MLTCDFTKRGSLSLTQFLYECIKIEILEGRIKAHEKLPSKRELSEHLGISVITVQNAFLQLIDEGWIYSVEKKGYFAEETGHMPSTSPSISDHNIPQNLPKPEINLVADFTSNSTSSQMFPFSTWTKSTKTVLDRYSTSILESQDFRGTLFLRNEICRYLKDFRGMDVDADQVVIGAGTETLYNMVIRYFGSEKVYGMENPGYKKLAKIFSSSSCKWVPLPMDKNGVIVKNLFDENVEVVHVTPSHHFPSGSVMSVKRRNELLEWAEKSDGFILEDDYDSEFRFLGQPLPTLYSAGKSGRTIYMNTFSKSLSPSFRISFMVIPKNLVESFVDRLGFFSCTVGSFEQYTLAQFIKEGHFERHIRRMKNYYKNLRNSLIYAMDHSELKNYFSIYEEHAGLHFLMKVNGNKNGRELQKKLLSNGIKMALLSDYELSENTSDFFEEPVFVINYSGIEKEKIPEIVEKMVLGLCKE